MPESLTDSLYIFWTGAAILRLRGSRKNYAYLLHTSLRQADHTQATSLITQFVTGLKNELTSGEPLSISTTVGFQKAYADLRETFSPIQSFEDVMVMVRNFIVSTDISEVNAATGREVSPNPSRMHTIYIGGAKIGRGVTIKNLLVTYYGRDAQRPQIDTVLQHARMYGYRRDELPAIRIYVPLHLAQRFYDIHVHNDQVREACQQAGEPIPILPIRGRLNPTRRNVLNDTTVNLRTYVGGRQYFPRDPISDPRILGNQTSEIDNLLSSYCNEQEAYTTSIDELLTVLGFQYQSNESNSGFWNDEFIRTALTEIRDSPDFGNDASIVVVNRDANITRSRTTGFVGAVLPGGAGNVPYGIRRDWPALYMTRLNGTADSWENHPFWMPLIRFPDGIYAFVANYS